MVSLQSALLPEAKRPPCLSLGGGGVVASTASSKKRKRDAAADDAHEDSRGEVVDGIELNFDAAPLPPEWQRCLDIKSGQIHYYNTRTHKRTWKDPRADDDPERRAAMAADEEDEEESANCAAAGLDLELNLNFEPRPRVVAVKEKRPKPAADRRRPAVDAEDGREMVPAVCVRCHMLVMMCRASPACPNCKFQPHQPSRASLPPPEPEPLKLGLQLLCCRD
ncbi:hypothetical protein EJB05_07721 [Eragrostis curvula]|uniref:WW domain-containing protein n=1 Tax=Eragrostis curvula TaxID=38414 RepID=A0A5J9WIQ0_9POAL|nr:hypothetical protein EJB05_07721 [Eragrostis curvula]